MSVVLVLFKQFWRVFSHQRLRSILVSRVVSPPVIHTLPQNSDHLQCLQQRLSGVRQKRSRQLVPGFQCSRAALLSTTLAFLEIQVRNTRRCVPRVTLIRSVVTSPAFSSHTVPVVLLRPSEVNIQSPPSRRPPVTFQGLSYCSQPRSENIHGKLQK